MKKLGLVAASAALLLGSAMAASPVRSYVNRTVPTNTLNVAGTVTLSANQLKGLLSSQSDQLPSYVVPCCAALKPGRLLSGVNGQPLSKGPSF
jgi:hypothetical protein